MNKTVYIVYGDTYEEPYGSEITLFGIFTTIDGAQHCLQEILKQYGDIGNIEEIEMDKVIDKYLGGYWE